MEPITFTIFGRPQVKQRPRIGKNKIVYTPTKTVTYEHEVAWRAKRYFKKPLEGPLHVVMLFYFKDKRNLGDLDNFCKALADGMNKIAYHDDKQIRRLEAEIRFDSIERAEVEIREYEGVR
jgi:crossover junction endodeoxyribonuclease RusA